MTAGRRRVEVGFAFPDDVPAFLVYDGVMKSRLITFIFASLSLTMATRADVGRTSLDDAQKATLLLNNAMGEIADAPFRLEVNAFKPCALRGDDNTGALAVPVYSLKHKIESARPKTPIPVAQLWLHKVVPLINGKPADKESLRLVKVKTNEGEAEVSMYHVAFQRAGKGGKLILYGEGEKPLLEITLKPMNVPQEMPIDLEARKGENGGPLLVLYVADKYEGNLPLAHAD